MRFITIVLFLGGSLSSFAAGPSLTLGSGRLAANGVVTLPLTFDPGSDGDASSLQWTIVYDPAIFRDILVREGPAADAGSKLVSCAGQRGSLTCLLAGWNQTATPAGVVVLVELRGTPSPSGDLSPVLVQGALAATPDGDSLAVSATGGSVDTATPRELTSLSCNPSAFDTPGETVCTATLNAPAVTGGALVRLTSNNPVLTIPSDVTISAGASSASFRAQAGPLMRSVTVQLTATFEDSTARTTVRLAGVHPVSLSCNPDSVRAGERILCVARLSSSHPDGPVTLALSSSSRDVMVPVTINVRSGQPNATFQALTALAAPDQSLTLSATDGDSTVEETISIDPQPAPVLSVPPEQFVVVGHQLDFRVTAADPGGSRVTLAAAGLPEGARFDTGTGDFSWTPGAVQLGSYEVRFTAANSAGESSTAVVPITVGPGGTLVFGIAHSASFQIQQVCSPGSLASVFGANFTAGPPLEMPSLPAPTELNGVRVSIDGQSAGLLYVSSGQINFQCPQAQPGTQLNLVVQGPSGSSEPLSMTVYETSPGIFALGGNGKGQGSIVFAGTGDLAKVRDVLAPGEPAWPGDIVSIYATGLGAAASLRSSITVRIGGVESEVVATGMAPLGIAQIDVRIPENVQTGPSIPLSVVVTPPQGQPLATNEVTLAIEEKP
jgi:uncharacterized protein (TIGR03437 family)